MSDDWRPHPRYRANSFQAAFCADPRCGLHIVAYNEAGEPMAEIVMSPEQTLATIKVCQGLLYRKAVEGE